MEVFTCHYYIDNADTVALEDTPGVRKAADCSETSDESKVRM